MLSSNSHCPAIISQHFPAAVLSAVVSARLIQRKSDIWSTYPVDLEWVELATLAPVTLLVSEYISTSMSLNSSPADKHRKTARQHCILLLKVKCHFYALHTKSRKSHI